MLLPNIDGEGIEKAEGDWGAHQDHCWGISEASLRHTFGGRVNPEATRFGPSPIFSQEEETNFVEYLRLMALCGYGCSRSEVVYMASEYAFCLQKRCRDHPL